MDAYDTMVEALNGLRNQGYTEDFNIKKDTLRCDRLNIIVSTDEFEIDKFFRFEGDSNPDDSSILYAVSSDKYGIKGVLVNSYGIYSDPLTDAMLEKLK